MFENVSARARHGILNLAMTVLLVSWRKTPPIRYFAVFPHLPISLSPYLPTSHLPIYLPVLLARVVRLPVHYLLLDVASPQTPNAGTDPSSGRHPPEPTSLHTASRMPEKKTVLAYRGLLARTNTRVIARS